MSFYALVVQGRVLGFRENTDEGSLDLAERTALVMWSGEPISIFEIEGRMPTDVGKAMQAFETYLAEHPEQEAVSTVDADTSEGEGETTGAYVRASGGPGESGFFASVG